MSLPTSGSDMVRLQNLFKQCNTVELSKRQCCLLDIQKYPVNTPTCITDKLIHHSTDSTNEKQIHLYEPKTCRSNINKTLSSQHLHQPMCVQFCETQLRTVFYPTNIPFDHKNIVFSVTMTIFLRYRQKETCTNQSPSVSLPTLCLPFRIHWIR